MQRDSHAFRGGQRHQRMMDETNPQRAISFPFLYGFVRWDGNSNPPKEKRCPCRQAAQTPEFTILELREPKASGSSFFVKKRLPKMGVSII